MNGQFWDVIIVPEHYPMLYRSDGSKTIGACDNELKTIYIQEGLGDRLTRKVLCHEITHAAMFSYNVILSYEQEELLADLFATYGDEIINAVNEVFVKLKMGISYY